MTKPDWQRLLERSRALDRLYLCWDWWDRIRRHTGHKTDVNRARRAWRDYKAMRDQPPDPRPG